MRMSGRGRSAVGTILYVSLMVLLLMTSGFGIVQAEPPAHQRAARATTRREAAPRDERARAGVQSATKTVSFPANALNYNASFGAITQAGGGTLAGLNWNSGGGGGTAAFLYLARPADWNGADVTLRLHFLPTTNTSGQVSFFIRPRAYDPGDSHVDAASLSGTPVAVNLVQQVREQVFSIPAARFGSKALWAIAIQRGGTGETYTDPVTLLAVTVSYNKSVYLIYLPFVQR